MKSQFQSNCGLALRTWCSPAAVLVALGAMTHVAADANAQPVLVQSRFDSSAEGWTIATIPGGLECGPSFSTVSFSPTYQATGGNPAGYIRLVEPDANWSFWKAPPSFLGNQSAAYGGVLSFDLIQIQTTLGTTSTSLVILQGSSTNLFLTTPYVPEHRWSRYHALLAGGGSWHVGSCAGPIATEAQVQQTLANLTGLFIRAEFLSSAADTDGIDNVVITGPSVTLPRSTFDIDGEDWWVLNDANPPTWSGTTGNPGGCINAVDQHDGRCWRFLAPPKFLGDRTAALGLTLEFDLLAVGATGCDNSSFVTIQGAGIALDFDFAILPGNLVWRRIDVPLSPNTAWVRRGVGPATASDFATVLSGVSELSIRGEFVSGTDNASFDNVTFGSCSPSGLASASVHYFCQGSSATIGISPAGATPFTFRWWKLGSPSTALSDGQTPTGSIISGAATATLMIGGLTPADAAQYYCVVSNSCGSANSNPVTLAFCYANCDCSTSPPILNANDFQCFLNRFAAANPSANCDGLTTPPILNANDFQCFLNAYATGCP
jgi:hypothetical protein